VFQATSFKHILTCDFAPEEEVAPTNTERCYSDDTFWSGLSAKYCIAV